MKTQKKWGIWMDPILNANLIDVEATSRNPVLHQKI
jgi:hypothetical protein